MQVYTVNHSKGECDLSVPGFHDLKEVACQALKTLSRAHFDSMKLEGVKLSW